MSGVTEAELKFALRASEIAALEGSPDVDGLRVGVAEVANLSTTYFDTADQRLRRAHSTLRIRTRDGRHKQTAKFGSVSGAGIASRTELEVEADGAEPDLARFGDDDLGARLRDLVDGAPFQPVFTSTVTRTTRTIVTPQGDEVEFAVDRGEIVAGDRRTEIHEAEFELKSGDIRALYVVAKAVMAPVPIRFSAIAKSEVGFRLLDGALGGVAPAKAVDATLAPGMSVEQALRAILRSCFDQVVSNVEAVLETEDPEGPHQLRVGLRRLRSAMTLFKPVIDPASAARVNDQLRLLGRAVGELRDLDVLVEEIVGPCRERIDVSGLLDVLSTRRDAVKKDLVGTLASADTGAFLIDLAAYVEGRGWLSSSDLDQTGRLSQPVEDFARQAVHKRWRKVAAKGSDPDALSPEERHELRKAFKKLRYALDFLGDLLSGRDQKRLTKDVKAALNVLGYLNDVATAESMSALVSEAKSVAKRKDYPAIQRAIGYCLGWHGARAEEVWSRSLDSVSLKKGDF